MYILYVMYKCTCITNVHKWSTLCTMMNFQCQWKCNFILWISNFDQDQSADIRSNCISEHFSLLDRNLSFLKGFKKLYQTADWWIYNNHQTFHLAWHFIRKFSSNKDGEHNSTNLYQLNVQQLLTSIPSHQSGGQY